MRSAFHARPLAAVLGAAALLLSGGCGGQKVDTTAQRPSGASNCTDCHGSAATGSSAPPKTSKGQTATTDPGVGAHAAHVLAGPLHKPMACAECHPTPETIAAPHHNDGIVDVVFGGLARAGGAAPVWNKAATATSPALTCSATYCHGGTLHDGLNREPVWTQVGTGQAACGTCHGVPPTWTDAQGRAGHPDVTTLAGYDAAAPRKSCNQCHPSTVDANGDIDVASGRHIDGVLQIGARACTLCHGDVARTPVAISPAPGDAAHLAHLTGVHLAAAPVACTECHPNHFTMVDHPRGTAAAPVPALMTWGPLASAGGSVPTLVAGAPPTCATTYCHGATLAGGSHTAPAWTDTTAQATACGTCHGVPPTEAPAGPHPNLATALAALTPPITYDPAKARQFCFHCHPGTVDAAGNLLAAGGFHMNGYVDLFTDASGQPRTCTSCHGDPSKPVVIHAAPPKAVSGATAATDRGVGAHEAHLRGGLVSTGVSCNQCHPTVTDTDHAAKGAAVNGHVVDMAFGPLATNLGTSWPTWNGGPRYDAAGNRLGCGPTGGDCTCSAVYCHGDGLSGGSRPAPSWVGGAAEASCGACHGIPPPSPHVARLDCGTCHAGYTTTTVNLAAHVNGVVDASTLACTACHGDANRTPATAAAAPPVDTRGNTATTARGVGAHERHLVDGLLRRAMACTECHVVPTAMDHANGTVDLLFGPLARTAGAAAAWSPASLTCSSVYCHGATLGGGTAKTPVWTQVDGTFTRCGSCHGIPPPAAAPYNHPTSNGTDCGSCHTGYTSTVVNLALHIDGKVDATGGSCSSCHGDGSRVAVTGADPQVKSAPPKDHLGNLSVASRGVGAHLAHLDKGTGALAGPTACSECHVVPASVSDPGHNNGTTEIVFGPRARLVTRATPTTPAAGTVTPAPSYSASTLGCSATYCHGNYSSPTHPAGKTGASPAWTASGGLSCTSCHAVPTDSCHPPRFNHNGGNSCSSCHRDVNAAGTAITNPKLHVNGVVDGRCTDCHAGEPAGSEKNITCAP